MFEQLKEQWMVFVPIMGVMITASVAYLVGRPRWYAKLDEQYQKVWAPLHRLLNWPEKTEERDKEIEKLLYDNYQLVPQDIVKLWQNNSFNRFKAEVGSGFKYAARRLGYAKVQQSLYSIVVLGLVLLCVIFLVFALMIGIFPL